jgi:tRNA threonylcarbamoyladenosine biosynthesis protein TsaB
MRVLGIGSADKIISVALVDEGKLLFSSAAEEAHAEKVMFYISRAGIKPKDIEGVAVAAGPGSYSGLRGGLAAAKTLAQVLKVPLAAVSTLEAIAYNLINEAGTIAVVLPARLDEYNFALFRASKGRLYRLTNDLVIKIDVLVERISRVSGDIWVIGDSKGGEDIKGENFHFAEGILSRPYGVNVAKLGLEKIKAGKMDDPLRLIPRYSHLPNIREYKS